MSDIIAHRHTALLRVSEARVFDEIRAVLPLEDYVLAWVSPTELVIDPARIGELSQRLADRGLAPLMKRVPSAESADPGDATERTRRLR